MDEIIDPNQWININESDVDIEALDLDLDEESVKSEGQGDDHFIDTGKELQDLIKEDSLVKSDKEQKQEQHFVDAVSGLKVSFGVDQSVGGHQQQSLTDTQRTSPIPARYNANQEFKQNSSTLQNLISYDNLEKSMFDCTGDYSKLHQTVNNNTNFSRLEASMKRYPEISDLNHSFFIDALMSKSHIDKIGRGNQNSSAHKKKKTYKIDITSFEKVQLQLTSYVQYVIKSSWSDQIQEYNYTIKRRFNEFKCLNQYITKKYIGFVQPYFPDPSIQETLLPVIKYFKSDEDYLVDRQKKLENYLKKLASTAFILDDKAFEDFLSEAKEFQKVFDEQKERETFVKTYFNSFTDMISNFKNIIYQQEEPFLSDKDKVIQENLQQSVKQIQSHRLSITNLRNEFKRIKFEELSTYLKTGEVSAETELTLIDQQNMNYQQDFLSNYYKKYAIDSETDVIEKISTQLENILEILSDALQSFDNYNSNRDSLLKQILENQLQQNQTDLANTPNIKEANENEESDDIENTKSVQQNIKAQNETKQMQSYDFNQSTMQPTDFYSTTQQQNNSSIFVVTTKIDQIQIERAGKNLVKEFKSLLEIIFPDALNEFIEITQKHYFNHYNKELEQLEVQQELIK